MPDFVKGWQVQQYHTATPVEVDLSMVGDAGEVVNDSEFLAKLIPKRVYDAVCGKSDYVDKEFFQYFTEGDEETEWTVIYW